MAKIEIPDICEFDVPLQDQLRFETRTNGDEIMIKGVHLGEQMAATLAYLVNLKVPLHVEIKEKE
jgi:hypothetical protein